MQEKCNLVVSKNGHRGMCFCGKKKTFINVRVIPAGGQGKELNFEACSRCFFSDEILRSFLWEAGISLDDVSLVARSPNCFGEYESKGFPTTCCSDAHLPRTADIQANGLKYICPVCKEEYLETF